MSLLLSDHAVLRQVLDCLERVVREWFLTAVGRFESLGRQSAATLAIAPNAACIAADGGDAVDEDLLVRWSVAGGNDPLLATSKRRARRVRCSGLSWGPGPGLISESIGSECGGRGVVPVSERRPSVVRP